MPAPDRSPPRDAHGLDLRLGDYVVAVDDLGRRMAGTVDAIDPVLGDGVGVVPGTVRVGRCVCAPRLLRKATGEEVAEVQALVAAEARDAMLDRVDGALLEEKEARLYDDEADAFGDVA